MFINEERVVTLEYIFYQNKRDEANDNSNYHLLNLFKPESLDHENDKLGELNYNKDTEKSETKVHSYLKSHL